MTGRHLVLYVDGSVRGGGRGGVGYVLATPDGYPLVRRGEPLPFAVRSSNEVEYHALLRGLEVALLLGAESIECYCDSSLVVEQVHGRFACNAPHLQQLRAQALKLLEQFQSWSLERVESRFNPMAHTYATIASTQNRKRFFWQHPRKRNSINTQKEVRNDMKLVVTKPELLEADVYAVRLDAVEPVQGNFGEQLRWRFVVSDGEHKGTTLTAWSNLSSATNSKTLRWASALAGRQFTAGDVVDFDKLVGRQARAVVDVRTGGDGRQFNRITDLLPAKHVQQEEDAYDPFLEED